MAKAVKEVLNQKPFIKDTINIGAVNYSGLARHIKPEVEEKVEKEVNNNAVIMAVKRYAKNLEENPLSEKMEKALKKCELRMEGDVVDFTLTRTPENYQTVLEAYDEIDWEKGDKIYIYQSLTEIAVVIENKNQHLIEERIEDKEFIRKEKDLAMITIRTPEEMVGVPGVFHYLLGLIAEEGISLVDILSTHTNLVLIVKDEDAGRTYNTLFKATKG